MKDGNENKNNQLSKDKMATLSIILHESPSKLYVV